ncbi:hypothetical protein E4T80_06970 [Muribacter muris]|uniref:Uncharacterized protein n=1 Tax=Muribacter muris TaxID=67855 RepID=A0A4Y9K0D3_9PAST|nr:hypothetical protein [Muribacter muris]MBF0785205.1 hypothetical protein [Muribacter muris]MBF0827381.1 hypothetical protein [Muribacter muris]TFV10155.1 hypothetical protein E4T80_06970 [Muribacter muris]
MERTNIFNKFISKHHLYLDEWKRIYPKEQNQDNKFSFLNTEKEATALIFVAANICDWITQNSDRVYFQLSSLFSCLSESKYILARILGLKYIDKPFDENLFSLKELRLNTINRYHLHLNKVQIQELIHFLLVYEEFGSFIALSHNGYKLLNINDGFISLTLNHYVVNQSLANQLLHSPSGWNKWIWELDEC